MTQDLSLQINALRAQLEARTRVVQNIANLARTIYKPGDMIKYQYEDEKNMPKTGEGRVATVWRNGSEVMVAVTPKNGRKIRDIRVEDIIGKMMEIKYAAQASE